jgi:DNA polymerase III subunit epsilon
MYLFFDTETSGLPVDYYAPPSRGRNWPRLVTLAWVLTDAAGRELRSDHSLIRPEGWEISAEAEAIHGISTEQAQRDGQPLWPVLLRLRREIIPAGSLFAHNYQFDTCVLASEFMRQGAPDPFPGKLWFCTMRGSTNICKLPGKRAGEYKWPRLAELHRHLFGIEHDGQHDALADVRACCRCFFELRRRYLTADCGSPAELTAVFPVGR